MTKDTGGPAFPINDDVPGNQKGMTLLDFYRGLAMVANRLHPAFGNEDAEKIAQFADLDARALIAEKRRREA